MVVIHVPKPKNAFNPNRPINTLLKEQVERLHEAETRLPLRLQSNTYINAIRTEGEAAKYIQEITEAIHGAHEEAAEARTRPVRKHGIEIAAVADERAERKRKNKRKTSKKKASKPRSAKS